MDDREREIREALKGATGGEWEAQGYEVYAIGDEPFAEPVVWMGAENQPGGCTREEEFGPAAPSIKGIGDVPVVVTVLPPGRDHRPESRAEAAEKRVLEQRARERQGGGG